MWDIYEEHLDEAAFLWVQWERALCASNFTLSEVAEGPEERLLAHLDGLVLGGRPVAERLVLPALKDDDCGRVSASAWVLLQLEDVDHFDSVWSALTSAEDQGQRSAISRALELSRRTDLPDRLLPLLNHSEPAVKASIVDTIAAHSPAELARISLRDLGAQSHPELLGAVLRAVQRVPEPTHRHLIEHGLNSESLVTRSAAIEAGTMLRAPSTRAVCRRLVAERAPDRRLGMAVLALGGDPRDQARLIEWSHTPGLAEDALWALGFTGRVEVAELLLGRLDDTGVGPIAAESFSSITGLLIEGPLVQPGEAASLDAPADDDAPVPEVKPEDDLPVPRAERIRAWWRSNVGRIDPVARHSFGAPFSVQAIEAALSRAATWRRQVLRLGLPSEIAARIDLRQWARRQHA